MQQQGEAYLTPPYSPAQVSSEESDAPPESVTMMSTWPITTLETLAHSYIMVNTSLKDYYEAWYQERRARMLKSDILTQQVVPHIIQLAHSMYNPRPNNYQGLLRQLTRTTLQEHRLFDAFRGVWRNVVSKDDWIQLEPITNIIGHQWRRTYKIMSKNVNVAKLLVQSP
ncbi:hypothetical protein BCR42DRAFT_444433 [Absidia repens]|uniref:Uncharacterized protein n=1 Tax=Absidia repens TaxID=90262 RepID=A0A1X2HRF7_9FUNG|nr:hypothetical protein BCR42DRAFT_444433 [Absidia repens]